MSATETGPRAYPILSRACIGVGAAFLLLSAFGNWRFGWGLAHELIDKVWLALIYSGSDVAAGILCATGAVMLLHSGWRWKLGGIVATVPALILVSLSILSTFGMMSGRIAVSTGQKQAAQVDQDRLAWLRGQTLNRDVPKSERRMFRLEERNAAAEARKQASVVTDNQVVAIVNGAAMLGLKIKEETAQVGITFLTSTVPMMVKFCGIWLGFFLFGIRSPSGSKPANQDKSSGSGGGNVEPLRPKPKPVEPTPVRAEAKVSSATSGAKRKLSREEVMHRLRRQHAGFEPRKSSHENARWAGWPQRTMYRYDKRLREQAKTQMRRIAGNGGGRHLVAVG